MNSASVPSVEEFLSAPVEEIAKVAPATVVYGVGGTRRHAVFAGLEPWSDEFIHWARASTVSCTDLIFRHGVRNLITLPFVPSNFKEVNRYRDQLIERVQWGIAGPEALADYKRLGWRVRLLGAESVPELKETDEKLRAATPAQSQHTLYWSIVPNEETQWQELLAAAQRSQARTRAEVAKALYGEEITPATLYLAFGKPLISLTILPPLLIDQLQCYWSQQPGYTLSETQLRTILYDYAYLRTTWNEEKLERAKEAIAHRKAWEEGPILGLGMRLGPFWYPAPMSSSAWSSEEDSADNP
ncbi:MAG: hypothetical protein NT075_32275 [Chloroflexi bacterium]|nr:hypothetical protein [Chloroflexota bacterium]